MVAESKIENSKPIDSVATELEWEQIFDFVSNIIDSLAWPIVVLIILLSFRTHIVDAFKSLKSISYGGAEATFDRELNKVSDKAKAIELPDTQTAQENTDRVIELVNMTTVSPTGAIIETWKDIEQAARDVVEGSGLPLSGTPERPYFNLQNFLAKHELLPKAEIDTFRELRMIRNRAAHSGDFDITMDQAKRYINLADRLIDAIKTSAIIRKN